MADAGFPLQDSFGTGDVVTQAGGRGAQVRDQAACTTDLGDLAFEVFPFGGDDKFLLVALPARQAEVVAE